MSIQSNLTYADIALHQAELRREAKLSRLARRSRTRRGLWSRVFHRHSDTISTPALPDTAH